MLLNKPLGAMHTPLPKMLADDLCIQITEGGSVSARTLCYCQTAKSTVATLHLTRLSGQDSTDDAQFGYGLFSTSVIAWVKFQPGESEGVQQALLHLVEGRASMRTIDSGERLDGMLLAKLHKIKLDQAPRPRQHPKSLATKRQRSVTSRYQRP